jgi:putative FmdB family regulatory protein
MPTYEYRCAACAHTFEEFQSMTAEPFEICPHCGKPTLKRVIGGGAGMIFKGSGFYLTDYKKGPSEASTKSSSKGSKGDKPSTSEPPSSSKEEPSKPKPSS